MDISLESRQFTSEEAYAILEQLYKLYCGRIPKPNERQEFVPLLAHFGFLGIGYVLKKAILESDEMNQYAGDELLQLWNDRLGRPPEQEERDQYESYVRYFRAAGLEELATRIDQTFKLTQEADNLLAHGKPADAQRILEGIAPDALRSWQYWHSYGLALFRQRMFKNAIDAYKRAIDLNRSDDQGFFSSCEDLKWCCDGLHSLDPAIYQTAHQYFQQVIEHYPARWIGWHECGWTAWKGGQQAIAIPYYHKSLELNHDDSWGWTCTDLTSCYNEMGKQEEGLAFLIGVTKERPGQWGSWQGRAWLEWKHFHHQELALEAYVQAIATHPQGGWFWSWQDKGWLLFELQRFSEAREAFSRAAELEPANWRPWYALGNIAERQKRWEDAILAY